MTGTTILDKILATKQEEIQASTSRVSLADQEAMAQKNADERRGFVAAMDARIRQQQHAVIAEVKKASPSKGLIRPDFDPPLIASQYEEAGACCLSVLTDQPYFKGHNDYLVAARAATQLPVLRKDFIIDRYQVAEAGAIGADCILLIVSALPEAKIRELSAVAADLALDVLVEVHDEAELDIALNCGFKLIGVNNRNLHTFATDLETTLRLAERVPDDRLLVTESGIATAEDVKTMTDKGIYGFLVGETLMRVPDPRDAFRALFG
ncbi:indole-3-glycerol phosphate synthase TrpC [Pseudohongiella nitratireducens]|uniref:indole-3-glycerol phosphate synthase TrpC n=1 Tax=Pseudohongiella nitratireducens TaxID=1768907 RepID=UPI0030EF3E68